MFIQFYYWFYFLTKSGDILCFYAFYWSFREFAFSVLILKMAEIFIKGDHDTEFMVFPSHT